MFIREVTIGKRSNHTTLFVFFVNGETKTSNQDRQSAAGHKKDVTVTAAATATAPKIPQLPTKILRFAREPVVVQKLPEISRRKASVESDYQEYRVPTPSHIAPVSSKFLERSFDLSAAAAGRPKAHSVKFARPRPAELKSRVRKILSQLNGPAAAGKAAVPTQISRKGDRSFYIKKGGSGKLNKSTYYTSNVAAGVVTEHTAATEVGKKVTPKLSDFELIKTIGVGCYAKVKLAKWTTAEGGNRPCAIKIVSRKLATTLKQGTNLIREKRLLLSVLSCCPFIVKWYRVF